MTLRIAGT